MSDTINRLYENQFGTSPKTQQDADDYASMMNVWSNTKDPEEFAQAERNINVEGRMDENPNAGMLKYTYATADATGVAHDNIDAELANNRQEKLEKIILQSKEEGSIRALPYLQTAEGQQTMLDIAMGSAFPGAAIGRMSRASITGGGATPKSLQQSLQKLFNPKAFRDDMPMPKFDKEVLGRINANTETGVARSAWEKAMKKWDIKPNERTVNDPVTELLRSQKGSRFSPHRKN